ncbi:cobalt ECF transporter T component CbiQ [Paenibacillus puerhi]|uniref:cobalt ECF transporter T component CbiQ n=1 Tax=Paenibacillus puerhi TaxID=2692622 RepID=UPI00135CADEC|nr:cobalt ECF transporter T component CbiQ [Paenibacillus puerhi]
MIRRIDAYAYSNKLHPVSPLWKSGFAAALFALSYVGHPWVQTAIFGWMLVWIVGHAGIPLKFYAGLLALSLLFYAASLPALVLELNGTAGTLYVSEAGIDRAADLLCRTAACFAVLAFLVLTTPVTGLLQVLDKLRVPGLVIELVLITYRFIFLFADSALELYRAQRARGGQIGFRGRIRDTAILAGRLFVQAIQRYRGLAHGLAARGFTGDIRLSPCTSSDRPMPRAYLWEAGVGLAALLALQGWLLWREAL